MPANNPINRQDLKQYRFNLVAAAASLRVSPYAPRRTFLLIQNTGVNPALVHFGEPIQGGGGDLVLAANEKLGPFFIPASCPSEAINVQSDLGTTITLLEGVTRE